MKRMSTVNREPLTVDRRNKNQKINKYIVLQFNFFMLRCARQGMSVNMKRVSRSTVSNIIAAGAARKKRSQGGPWERRVMS